MCTMCAPASPWWCPPRHLDHVDILRIFDYADSVAPPDAPGRVPLPPPWGTLSLPAQFQPHADQGLHG
ncbi:hypothetical protein RAA17_06650 [Komagataeibacter rhaeticus]|nr:hypothetical protein [Komagataeibacter rhaeticus]